MFKKFNWGWGITIFIVIFFLSIFYRIYLSYQHDVNLVSKDYYPKGIRYQEQIDNTQNALQLGVRPKISTKSESMKIIFPKELTSDNTTGLLHFYRPSDPALDRKFHLKMDSSGTQFFPVSEFEHGKYILKMDINTPDKGYYFEEDVFVD